MSLLDAFKKKNAEEPALPKSTNRIEDREMKEWAADTAISNMEKGVDYEDLAGTKVEFGYLFDIENHGTEALFKVITDRTTAYFAIQGTKLLRLNLTQELFDAYTESFLLLHEDK